MGGGAGADCSVLAVAVGKPDIRAVVERFALISLLLRAGLVHAEALEHAGRLSEAVLSIVTRIA